MASHLSTIGFPVGSESEFVELANRALSIAAERDEIYPVDGGAYVRYHGKSGEELWMQLDEEGEPLGVNPHFAGLGEVRASVTAAILREDGSPLDGAFHAWANPPDDGGPEEGDYPFVFDVPDFAAHRNLVVPATVTAQIAAFAHEVAAFDSVEAYKRSDGFAEFPLSEQGFIPSGLFTPDMEAIDPPEALAFFAGTVLQAERLTNSLTGAPYAWCLVETLGGLYDVVADPELLAGTPKKGGVLSGSFWLSGRVRTG